MLKIKRQVKIIDARCDSPRCRRSLMAPAKPGEKSEHAHYGELKAHFGLGSKFDEVHGVEYQLCEDCWERACAAVGLPPTRPDPQEPPPRDRP